jgi:hypothetical protein
MIEAEGTGAGIPPSPREEQTDYLLDLMNQGKAKDKNVTPLKERLSALTSGSKELLPWAASETQEAEAWKKLLGIDVDIPPLPDYVTFPLYRDLEKNDMQVMYIPNLLYPTNLLMSGPRSVQNFVEGTQKKYPKLQQLDKGYWDYVKRKHIENPDPHRPGRWVAVETGDKPSDLNSPYPTQLARVPDMRYNTSFYAYTRSSTTLPEMWRNMRETSEVSRTGILPPKLPPQALFVPPTALEANLLFNRGLGKGNPQVYEWTGTHYKGEGDDIYAIATNGTDIIAKDPRNGYTDVGFRLCLSLPPSN